MLNRFKGNLYDLTARMATSFGRKKAKPKLLVLRTDEIGDFMLWRKFLGEIVRAERFKEYEIHFCGNSSWKNLFLCFDEPLVTRHFWLAKTRFKKSLWYRFNFLRLIYRENYEVVINPIFSRDKRNDDAIVKAARATINIGMVSNQESVKPYEKDYDRNLYTELFAHAEKPLFELYRNRLFTEFITGVPSKVTNTLVNLQQLPPIPFTLPNKFFIVFPGSRSAARIWPGKYFAEVSHYLFREYGWVPVICGSNNDKEYAKDFADHFKYPCENFTGKTSLPQLMQLLSKAECLLSVDTGSVHLAAATGCTVLGVFNGSQYGRFAPYPKEVAENVYSFYPDEVEKDIKNKNAPLSKYEFVVDIKYDAVLPQKIIQAIDNIFKYN
jgi:ADP-heptose:LPS heptosyltransferase